MMQLPIEAYQKADEASTRAEAVNDAAPFIIAATLRFAAGRKQSALTYLSRHLGTVFILLALLAVGTETTDTDHQLLLGCVALFTVFRAGTEELLLRRLLRRAVVFAKKRPEYWR